MAILNLWWANYEHFIKKRHVVNFANEESDINHWKDRLFVNFLIYCFPFSFIAVVPGITMAILYAKPVIAIVDTFCLFLLTYVVFSRKMSLKKGKTLVIGLFYVLSIFLIANLGYIGPGVFYLFGITMMVALILPIRFAYWSIWFNGIILACFALLISFKPFSFSLQSQYSLGQWIAFSSNLIFLSIVLVVLIHMIFDGVQSTIKTKDALQIKYKNIFNNSPTPMWLFDPASLRFLDVNDAAVTHYGYTKAQFMCMTITDIRPTENVSEIENIVQLNKDIRKFNKNNTVHIKKNGEHINVKIDSSLIDFNGNTAKLVLVTDITAKVKADQEVRRYNLKLKESEFNLRAIFESSIDGFILLDRNFIIRVFNSNAKKSIKLNNSSGDFETGKNIFDFVEPSISARFYDILASVFNGEVIEYDRNYKSEGEPESWIHYALTPVYEGEQITGVCVTGRDITTHKTYVQTIEKQNKTFREISWMQSHLVRAPLARLMGLTTLLKNAATDEDKAEMLRFLELTSNELDDIVRQITAKTTAITENSILSEAAHATDPAVNKLFEKEKIPH